MILLTTELIMFSFTEKLPKGPKMVLGYFFIPYNKVTGPLSMFVCLYLRILLTAELIWFSYTMKLPIGPEMGLGHFIFTPYIKETYLCLFVCTERSR